MGVVHTTGRNHRGESTMELSPRWWLPIQLRSFPSCYNFCMKHHNSLLILINSSKVSPMPCVPFKYRSNSCRALIWVRQGFDMCFASKTPFGPPQPSLFHSINETPDFPPVGQYTIVGSYGDFSGARVNVLSELVNWCTRGYSRLHDNLSHARVFEVI